LVGQTFGALISAIKCERKIRTAQNGFLKGNVIRKEVNGSNASSEQTTTNHINRLPPHRKTTMWTLSSEMLDEIEAEAETVNSRAKIRE
jgi:hypothetical protein